ncbi:MULTISPECIES: hypothetical protein [Actinoplanes]|uniref:hypothetical protein n=1 Tax=Actinoplanes TaxID=1865 RepID=UPI0005F2D1BF|nr:MULTISPECIES: hypothetical protein [Actinoplanes]GLY00950.1 hypothetical protein Acsp01_13290 [Actinoplanes sp. NBRC 101535]
MIAERGAEVLRVMAGWFLLGIGVLNVAVEVDGGLTPVYLLFHGVLAAAGSVALMRHRLRPSRAAVVVAGLLAAAGMLAGAVPTTTRCCLDAAFPQRRGFPFPFLGTGDGARLDLEYLFADLLFWACLAVVLLIVLARVEVLLPERRTPVAVPGYVPRHAEARLTAEEPTPAAPRHRRDENVGGLT